MQFKFGKTRILIVGSFISATFGVCALAQQIASLSIAGQAGSAKVVQIAGRNYVEVEGLARVANGTIGFSNNQIVLTLPAFSGSQEATPAAPPPGFSKEFITAGIETMAQIREWHTALRTAITRGLPLSEDWLNPYRDQAQQSLRLASVAVSTPADKNAFPFVTNEFNNMQNLSTKYLGYAKSLTYVDPNSLDGDPLDQKLRTCGRALASMATSNQFVDDGSCQ